MTPHQQPYDHELQLPYVIVRASFAGTAGQALTLGFTGVALGGSNDYWVTVVAPDGSKPVDCSLMSGSDSLQLDPLTATGSYTVIVNPAGASTGTITLSPVPA